MRPARSTFLAPLACGFAALLALPGCDAGNRADPGSDNAFRCPALTITAPYEGQQVVPSREKGPALALFDLRGASLGRGAGSTLRYRVQPLDRYGEPLAGTVVEAWTAVADPAKAVALGDLPPGSYRLDAEVLDASGAPWTRAEQAADGTSRTVHAEARAVRRFTVHTAWSKGS